MDTDLSLEEIELQKYTSDIKHEITKVIVSELTKQCSVPVNLRAVGINAALAQSFAQSTVQLICNGIVENEEESINLYKSVVNEFKIANNLAKENSNDAEPNKS